MLDIAFVQKWNFLLRSSFLWGSPLDEVGGKGISLRLNFSRALRLQKEHYLEEQVEGFGFSQYTSLIHGMKKDLSNNSEFL